MSLAVLKRKIDNKERHRRVNAVGGGYKIAVTNSGSNKSKCSGDQEKNLSFNNHTATCIVQEYKNT